MQRTPFTPLRSLLVAGLLLVLAAACGTSATPSDQPQAADIVPTVQTEPAATLVSQTIAREPASASEPTAILDASVVTNNPATETPPTAKASAATEADPAPTATATSVPDPTKAEVGAEPDWAKELRLAGINTGIWETNFSKHSVPYSEIFSGGVPRTAFRPSTSPGL